MAAIRQFAGDRRGATAPLFAISSLMVFGAIGLSIDGARVYSVQQRMQSAVNSAVLAAGRRASLDGTNANVEETFAKFMAAAPALQDVGLRPVTPDMSQPKRISAEIIADVSTVIMPVLGFSTVEVRAFASAEYGFTKLEIALALDTTGSMAGAKLEALKDLGGADGRYPARPGARRRRRSHLAGAVRAIRQCGPRKPRAILDRCARRL